MVVSGEYVSDTCAVNQREHPPPPREREVEVLIGFIGTLEEQRMMLKQDKMPCP